MEILHNYPTTLLHSLEGLHKDVDWEKLLRLQCANGSFLFSPASTACALAYTKDEKCLDYLNKLLLNFDNAGIITVLNKPGIISDKLFAIFTSNKMT